MELQEAYTPESIEFTKRLLAQSGTSDHTAWPPGIVKCLKDGDKRENTMEASRYVVRHCSVAWIVFRL
jgi:3-ketoacyl-CoA synthase